MTMTQEEKDLLLRDLCARLPYGTKVKHVSQDWSSDISSIDITRNIIWVLPNAQGLFSRETSYNVEYVKPYLRPLSSMTEEEYNEMNELVGWSAEMQLRTTGLRLWLNAYESDPTIWMVKILDVIDWLNAHHFDYRELIEKGLAIKVTEDNNPYKD